MDKHNVSPINRRLITKVKDVWLKRFIAESMLLKANQVFEICFIRRIIKLENKFLRQYGHGSAVKENAIAIVIFCEMSKDITRQNGKVL
jgi:hypothetical protein